MRRKNDTSLQESHVLQQVKAMEISRRIVRCVMLTPIEGAVPAEGGSEKCLEKNLGAWFESGAVIFLGNMLGAFDEDGT